MSRFTITTKEAGQSQVFNLKTVASAEDIIAVPAIQTGYYLIEGGEGNQLSEGLSLSRHNNALHIHIDDSAAPSAIIPEYYNSPALLTIPASNNQLQALDMAQIQTEHAPVALSLLADAGDTPYTPGGPGIIIADSATDDSVDGSPKEIGNHEGTADLTPELHGTAFGAEEMILTIYANTQVLGTVIVGDDGTWSFTPDEGALSYGSNYIFQVVLEDSSTNALFIAMPFTVSETVDGQAAADLPNTGDDGIVLIDHLVDANGIHQGDVANNGITDDLNPVIQGTLFGGEEMTVSIYANTQFIGTAIVQEDGTWSYDLSGLENHAQYTIVAILTDSSSDAKFISLPFVFTTGFDEQVPVITSVHDDAGTVTGDLTDGQPTDDTTPTINGTADPDAIVNIYDGSTLLGSAQVDGSGHWTFTPDTPLSGDGAHYISVTATDGTDESAHSAGFDVNLDTVCEKPVITDIQDDVGSVTGNVLDNGNITDDGNVVISGTSEPGSSLTLFFTGVDNTIQSLELTPNADGTWSIPSDYMEQKGDGAYNYWLTSVDAAGNKSNSDIVTVTYKTAPPDASTNEQLTDDVEPKTGPILNGDTTDDSTPTYQGDAEANDVVIISDNGEVIGSVVADDKGHWTFTPDTPLNDGDHSFSTVVVDGNGKQSDSSAPIGFTVDTAVPDPIDINAPDNLVVYDDIAPIIGDIPQDGVTNDTMPTFSGTTPALAKGEIVTIYSDGEVLGSAIVGDGGAWNFTPSSPMAEGPHEIELTVTNAAGAESDKSLPFDFTIDTIAPVAPTITDVVDDSGAQNVDVAPNGSTSDNTPQIQGTGEAEGDIITVYNNGAAIGSAVVGADGTWSFTPDALADGQYDITVTETDAAGNVSDPSNAYDFTIDTIAPVAPVITDVVDDSGAQNVDVAQNGSTNDNTPQIQGTGEAEGDIITVYNGDEVLGSAMVGADGTWTFTPDALADGTYDITVTETDAAGNVSDPSNAYDFTIDTIAPVAPVITDVVDDSGAQNVDVAQNGST
ncbi:Ig-like domain-containing protein, partial [Rahnella ecdela]